VENMEWGLALTMALFVANSELWERYKALPSGNALTLAFAPKAQALAEIPWEYAWDLAAKTPLAAGPSTGPPLAGPALPSTRVPSALFPTFSVPLPAG
jgi:hypothetical protein